MRNNLSIAFDSLSVEQTEALLAGFDSMPVDSTAARRIRRRVEKAAAPMRPRRRIAIRFLVPVAACLVALLLACACFPQVAQAIASFFGIQINASRYMETDPSVRTPIASIDEALDAAVPADVSHSVALLPELPEADAYAAWREKTGQPAFTETDWGWLREIRPEIAEVLYDGSTLIWNTGLYTDPAPFLWSFVEGQTPAKQNVDAFVDSDVTYTVAGDPTVYRFFCDSTGVLPPDYETERFRNDERVLLHGGASLAEAPAGTEKLLPDGLITVTQTIRIIDYNVDVQANIATVALITHSFTFDATAGNAAAAQAAANTLPLSGEIYLSMDHMDIADDGRMNSWTMDTRKVSLDGVSLKVETEYLATGIRVRITLADAPDGWTEEMTNGLLRMTWRNIHDKFETRGVGADLYVNGEFVCEAPRPDKYGPDELLYILPIFPNDYASVDLVALNLTYACYATLNGNDLLGGEVYTVPEGGVELISETQTVPLTEITISIP